MSSPVMSYPAAGAAATRRRRSRQAPGPGRSEGTGEPERGTAVVDLVRTGVPFADKFGNETVHDTVENGWKGLIRARIRMAFGYGVGF